MSTSYEPGSGNGAAGREPLSSIALLRRLTDELAVLLRQELTLATAEVTRATRSLLAAAATIAVGGAIAFMGGLALLAAAVLGLAHLLPAWLATLLIGVAVALIGTVVVLLGVRSLKPAAFAPRRTTESLRRDRDVLTRSARHTEH